MTEEKLQATLDRIAIFNPHPVQYKAGLPTIRPRNPVTTDTVLFEPKHLHPTYCNRVRHAQCPLDVLFRYVPTVSGVLSRRNVKVRNLLFNDAVSRYKYMASVVD